MKKQGEMNILREAAKWRMTALLFECPSEEWKREVAMLSAELDDENLRKAAARAQDEAREGLYHATFGPGGPAPPREVTYRSWVQPGYLLAELSAFYDAFAYRPKTPDVPDHVAVEAGFIAYLKLKSVFAMANGDIEAARVSQDAAERFASDHISKFAEILAGSLEFSGIQYLALAGKSLFRLVGKDPDSKRVPLPVLHEVESDEFTCAVAREFV
ncbi:MAG TPA: molecular chaperone TorD family protein [Pyrinomonadaceae bacterium]|nr:molecular chaperone TorD family protein [Pyrinomonadaceae bacterium]